MPLAEMAFSKEEISSRVAELARTLESQLMGERPLLVSVLKGSVMFLSDLVRNLSIDPDIDFMSISSYVPGHDRTGVVKIVKDLEEPLEGRDVVLVEDIVDTGLTLSYLIRTLMTRGPRSIRVCTLVNKPVRRIAELDVDLAGFESSHFLIGYGLDFKGRYRNLPYLAAVQDIAALAAQPDSLAHLFSDSEPVEDRSNL